MANGNGYAGGGFFPPAVDTSPSAVGASDPMPSQRELLVEILAELKEIKTLLAAQYHQYVPANLSELPPPVPKPPKTVLTDRGI